MIAVIFELEPKTEQRKAYFSIAEDLKPLVEKMDVFLSIERFQSVLNSEIWAYEDFSKLQTEGGQRNTRLRNDRKGASA